MIYEPYRPAHSEDIVTTLSREEFDLLIGTLCRAARTHDADTLVIKQAHGQRADDKIREHEHT